jgi:hypothetical protein
MATNPRATRKWSQQLSRKVNAEDGLPRTHVISAPGNIGYRIKMYSVSAVAASELPATHPNRTQGGTYMRGNAQKERREGLRREGNIVCPHPYLWNGKMTINIR